MIETDEYILVMDREILLSIVFESQTRKQSFFQNFKMFIRGPHSIYLLNTKNELYQFDGERTNLMYTLTQNISNNAYIVNEYLFFIENNQLKRLNLETNEIIVQTARKSTNFFTILSDVIFMVDSKIREVTRCDLNFTLLKGSKFLMSPPQQIRTIGNVVCIICKDLWELFDGDGNTIFKFDLRQMSTILTVSYCNVKLENKYRLMMVTDQKKVYFIETEKQLHTIVDGGHGICSVCGMLSHEVKCSKCGRCFHYRCIKNTPRQFEICLPQKK